MAEEGKIVKDWPEPTSREDGRAKQDCMLDRRHRELAALVQHSPDAILRFDSQKSYVFVNWMAERYTGMPAEKMIGKRLDELPIPGDTDGKWSRALDRVFETASPTSFEQESCTPRGERYFEVRLVPEQDADGRFDTVLAVARDMTKQRHHARRLEESEERWRRLMDYNPDAVVVFAEDQFIYGNRAASRLFRVDHPSDLIGRNVFDFFSAEDYEAIQGRFKKLYAGAEVDPHQYRMIRTDGEECDVLVYSVPIRYAGKRAVQTVMHDVTEQLEYERHLIEARQRAEEIARLKSSIITNLSHEIRTPLANVLGFNEVLRDHVDAEGKQMLDVVANGVERLMSTLTTVLELGCLESGELALTVGRVDVVDVLERELSELRTQTERKRLVMELSVPPDPVFAKIDAGMLHQIVRNLLDNAVKFTDSGEVSVSVACEGRDLRLAVQDTGVGIGADFLPRIFDEFEQESKGMSRHFEGIGLGLSIVKRLVEICGAQITVESTPGTGSTFTIIFPGVLSPAAKEYR